MDLDLAAALEAEIRRLSPASGHPPWDGVLPSIAERLADAVGRHLESRAAGPDLSRIAVVGRDLPEVGECYGHQRSSAVEKSCPQCDGRHRHRWRRCLVVSGEHFDVATRCEVCGGRKCDDPACVERRHHGGPHLGADGSVRPVGK